MIGRRGVRGTRLHARTALLWIAVVMVDGCGGGQPRATDASGDATRPGTAVDTVPARPDDEIVAGAVPAGCNELHQGILAVQPTRAAFAAAFGRPDTVIAMTEPNRHVPNAVDSLFTVAYPGFVMELRTPSDARDMATSVAVEDNRYLAWPGIGIGVSADRVRAVLGPPAASGSERITWDCGMEVEEPVTFVIDDGRVVRIEISYYVD